MIKNIKIYIYLNIIKFQVLYNLINVVKKKFNENPYLSVSYLFLKFDEFIKMKM